MGQKSWPEERAEIAIWLSGFLGTYKKWLDKILDNDDHDVSKNHIIETLDGWIEYLQEERQKIMLMRSGPIKEEKTTINEYGDDEWANPH